jgi:glycosyltransferase involved in cell wall biosynthesis
VRFRAHPARHPYRHVLAKDRTELARAYQALDVYVVASRQEGGPKGVLESLASGVPLVTTRVGQAQEIVADGQSALVVDVDDAEALAGSVLRLRDDTELADVARHRRPRHRRGLRIRAARSRLGRAPRATGRE